MTPGGNEGSDQGRAPMRPRWRAVLRVRMFVRLLLDAHVPLGALSRCVASVLEMSDRELPNEQRVHADSIVGALARDIVNDLIDEEPFDVEAADAWLDGREFYDLMQAYRVAPVERQSSVLEAFDAVKTALRRRLPRRPVAPAFFNLASLVDAQHAAAKASDAFTAKQLATIAYVLGEASHERMAAGERLDDDGNLIT